jgi:transcription antitermination factor NusB
LRRRSQARAIAVQALYQFDLQGEDFSRGLTAFIREWSQDNEVREYARLLVEGCRMALPDLDAMIAAKAANWDLRRMAAVDRNILRVGAYELVYGSGVPPKTAVDEAVRLAKKYSTEESSAFVNGVLDKIMADVAGRAERKS